MPKTAALTLPRGLMLAGVGLLIWSLVFVVNEPEGWHFILLIDRLALGPALAAGVALWTALAEIPDVTPTPPGARLLPQNAE
jgi:hypothetical protein